MRRALFTLAILSSFASCASAAITFQAIPVGASSGSEGGYDFASSPAGSGEVYANSGGERWFGPNSSATGGRTTLVIEDAAAGVFTFEMLDLIDFRERFDSPIVARGYFLGTLMDTDSFVLEVGSVWQSFIATNLIDDTIDRLEIDLVQFGLNDQAVDNIVLVREEDVEPIPEPAAWAVWSLLTVVATATVARRAADRI
jgi:hypothetical protein